MDKFTAFMQKRVAGVPVSIIMLLLVGIALFAAFRMKSSPVVEDTEATDDAAATVADEYSDGEATPQFRSNVALYSAGSSTTPTLTDTNAAWGRRAKEWLIGRGGDINLVTNAIDKYLGGEELTSEESKKKDEAVRQFGLPPEEFTFGGTVNPSEDIDGTVDEPTDPVTTPTTPVAVPAAAVRQGTPPCVHTVAGPNDNNGPDLARLYYGATNKTLRDLIVNNNTAQGEPPWRPGTRVRIPKKAAATTTPTPQAPVKGGSNGGGNGGNGGGGGGGGIRESSELAFPAPVRVANPPKSSPPKATADPKFFVTTAQVRGAQEIAARNGLSRAQVVALNPNKDFPVKAGVRVRVG